MISNPKLHTNILVGSAIAATFIATYFPVLQELVKTWWRSDEYSHGFLIVPICCYIIWLKRNQLQSITYKPSIVGLIISICSLAVYVIGFYAGISTLCYLTIVPFWVGCVIYLYGYEMAKALFFPFLLLFFMIPVPSQLYSLLTIPLQLFVSKISVTSASNLGVPIYGEGNLIFLKDRTLEVVEACSGLRSLISLLTLSLIFGYFTLGSNILRGILFISAIPVAIFVNIVRVVLIVMALEYFDFDLTLDKYHSWFGLLIFILALVTIAAEKGVLGIWDPSDKQER